MPYQKEQLKYSVVSVIIGSLLWFLFDRVFIALNFSGYFAPLFLSISLGVFLGVFLVLTIIGKQRTPPFSLILPIFLIYFAITSLISLIQNVLGYISIGPLPYYPLSQLLLDWLLHAIPHLAVFSLIGTAAGIVMVRATSKLKYDAFYFIFSSLIGVGAGTMLIRISWAVRFTVPYSPLFPYLSLLTLIGPIIGIIIVQIAWLRKRQTSNSHTCISVAFWIIAFIAAVFLYEWVTYVHPPWF